MSLLKYLQFQPIDIESDSDEIDATHQPEEPIHLREEINEEDLDAFWDSVVADIHEDPEWFNFSEE